MNRLIKQLTDMGFPVCGNICIKKVHIGMQSFIVFNMPVFNLLWLWLNADSSAVQCRNTWRCTQWYHGQWQAFVIHVLQRDPAEEALKSNNMNLDQAMSKFTKIFVYVSLCVHCKELICYAFAKSDGTNAQLIYSQGIKIRMKFFCNFFTSILQWIPSHNLLTKCLIHWYIYTRKNNTFKIHHYRFDFLFKCYN